MKKQIFIIALTCIFVMSAYQIFAAPTFFGYKTWRDAATHKSGPQMSHTTASTETDSWEKKYFSAHKLSAPYSCQQASIGREEAVRLIDSYMRDKTTDPYSINRKSESCNHYMFHVVEPGGKSIDRLMVLKKSGTIHTAKDPSTGASMDDSWTKSSIFPQKYKAGEMNFCQRGTITKDEAITNVRMLLSAKLNDTYHFGNRKETCHDYLIDILDHQGAMIDRIKIDKRSGEAMSVL